MKLSNYLFILILLSLATMLFAQSARRVTIASRLTGIAPGSPIALPKIIQPASRILRISKAKVFEIDSQLPDLVELLAASVLASISLHGSLQRIVDSASGSVVAEFSLLLRRLDLGSSFEVELSALCERMPTPGIRELANKISIAINRGTPLAHALVALSESLRSKHANQLLARAGANETKMLIPLVTLVLPTTVMFAIYPSVQFLNVGFN